MKAILENFSTHDSILDLGHPQTVVWSKYVFPEKIKLENDEDKRNELKTTTKIHVQQSKQFYKLLWKKNYKVVMFSFNVQKNQAVSKLPDKCLL